MEPSLSPRRAVPEAIVAKKAVAKKKAA